MFYITSSKKNYATYINKTNRDFKQKYESFINAKLLNS